MMRSLFASALFALLSAASPAQAQFQLGVEDFIGKRTLRLSSGVDLDLTRFGNDLVVGSATAFAAVRDVQAVLDTVVPAINRQTSCAARRAARQDYGFEILDVRIDGSTATPGGLVLGGVANYSGCSHNQIGRLLFDGQARFAIPLTAVVRSGTVRVSAGKLTVEAGGVGIHTAYLSRLLTPHVAPVVEKLNGQIARELSSQALRRYADTYRLKLQSAQLASQSGDLVLTVTMSGQAKVKQLNAAIAVSGAGDI